MTPWTSEAVEDILGVIARRMNMVITRSSRKSVLVVRRESLLESDAGHARVKLRKNVIVRGLVLARARVRGHIRVLNRARVTTTTTRKSVVLDQLVPMGTRAQRARLA